MGGGVGNRALRSLHSVLDTELKDLTEHTLESETVFRGRLLHVKKDTVRLPDGKVSTREYITHPGAVVVIPVFDNGDLLLERQHRYPLRRDFIEFPAGKLDPGEDPLDCARRELREETGYVARTFDYLTTVHPCIGYSDERLIFFLARGLAHEGHDPDDDEFLEVLRVSRADALAMLDDGRISEAKTVIGLMWLSRLERG